MVLQSRREYLSAIGKRYRKATRKENSIILGEFCVTCGYNRKYAIRLLRKKSLPVPNRKPGPVVFYPKDQLLVPLKRGPLMNMWAFSSFWDFNTEYYAQILMSHYHRGSDSIAPAKTAPR